MKKFLFLFSLLISLIFYGISFANSSNNNLKTNSKYEAYELSEVVVSADKPVSESAGTVYRITAEEIKNTGANNLEEALQHVPGILIRTGNAGTPRVDIRGFRTRHVQLLLNGVPMNDTYDGQFDPTTIPVDFIAEIKIISGAASVLYGTGGNGGVINIITKKAVKGFHGSAGVEVAERDAYLGKAVISGAGENWHAFVSGNIFDRDGFSLSENFDETDYQKEDKRENSDRQRKNIFANLGVTPTKRTSFGLTFNYINGENGIPPITNYSKDDPFTKKIKYERIDRTEGMLTQFSFKHRSLNDFYFKCSAFLNELDNLKNTYDNDNYNTQDVKGAKQDDTETTIMSGYHLQFGKDMKKAGRLEIALLSNEEKWEMSGFEIDKKNNKIDLNDRRNIYKHSIAASYNLTIKNRMGIVAEYGHHVMVKESSKNDFSYLLGMDVDVCSVTKLKASHAKKVRFPSLKQLYDTDYGNEALVPEQSYHYELGLQQKLPGSTKLNLTGFYIQADDFIEKNEGPYENNEKYIFKGAEVCLINQMIKAMRLSLTYSYLHTKDDTEGSQKDELQHRPQDKITFQGDYLFPFGLNIHLDYLYVGKQFFYDSDGNDPLEKKRLNDYSVVNLKISQKLSRPNLYFYIGAENLLDEDYEQSYGLPRPGQNIYGGMEWQW